MAEPSSTRTRASVARNALEISSKARGLFLESGLKKFSTSSFRERERARYSTKVVGDWYFCKTFRPNSICRKTMPKSQTSVFWVYCGLDAPAISGGNQYA